LASALGYAQAHKSRVHLVGLLGEGKINSSQKQLYALLDFFNIKDSKQQIFIHGILDGIDVPKDSGKKNLEELINRIDKMGNKAKLATLSGRYYALDRNNHWDRTAKTYQALIGSRLINWSKELPIEFLEKKYQDKIYDNDIEPTVFYDQGTIKNDDVIIFFNVRPDFIRQLSQAISLPSFSKFEREPYPANLFTAGFLEYDRHLPQASIFPDNFIEKSLGEVISDAGFKQLRISDTYKFSFLTHFFDGLKDEPYKNENWELITPEIVEDHFRWLDNSTEEISKRVIRYLEKDEYQFLALDFSLIDMAARTGNIEKTILACEKIDKILRQHFKLEFLNRIDETVIFQSLTKEDLTKIVDLELIKVENRLHTKNIALRISPKVKKLLAEKGYDVIEAVDGRDALA